MQLELDNDKIYRTIFMTATDAIVIFDGQDGHFLEVNDAAVSLYGYSRKEFLALHYLDLSANTGKSEASIKELLAGTTLRSRKNVHRKRDGSIFPVEISSNAVMTANRTIICGIVRDITDSERVEDELRNLAEFNHEIVSGAGEGIIVFDRDLRYVEWNKFMEEMTGIKRSEVLGKMASDMLPHIKEQGVDRMLERALSGEFAVTHDIPFRIPQTGKTGWAIGTYAPHKDAAGRTIGVIALVRDISERKRMEEELQRVDKIESLGVFAGGIAHDFNNLLGGIYGFMDLARYKLDPGKPAAQYLDKAFSVFERAKNLSKQLLTFAKGGSLLKKRVFLPSVLEECFSLILSGSNVKHTLTCDNGLWPVEADEHQLSQVFSNIALNARQAMPEGGCIEVNAENRLLEANVMGKLPAGKYVSIAIKDQGAGIPEKNLTKIFDPFFTTKRQGSGLGLAISHSIVNRHGGHIDVMSSPGAGAVFTVWLPASNSESSESRTREKISKSLNRDDEEVLNGAGRILVMDDEQAIAQIAQAMLVSGGYSVSIASNGSTALKQYRDAAAQGSPFNLVVLDLTIRGGAGGEKVLAEMLKTNPGILAIVSSGYSDEQILDNPTAYGFAAMIAKPYRRNELLRTVKRVLSEKPGA